MDIDQIKNILNAAAEKGREYAGVAVEKTKAAGRLAKLTMELAGEKESLKKAYVELGKAYYEENHTTAEGLFAQLCEEVDAVNGRIKTMQAEVDAMKASFGGTAACEDADFEDVVAQDEKSTTEPAEPAKPEEPAAPETPKDEEHHEE